MNDNLKQDALEYHRSGRPGKLEVIPSKPYSTQRDLALAYSPGVAEPVLAIAEDPARAYEYTTKGNLVAVISNGTAILGLGDRGALASKPVMEGKGMLFKIFADIDVFDIEVDQTDPDKFIEVVKAIAPTFGGINLEDIKAPEAFYIERRLREELDIPVMHDDQHGTAIISAAALINALELNGKKIEDIRIVVLGAGAAAISCAKIYLALGARAENLLMFDSKGKLHAGRTDLDENKTPFANGSDQTVEEALHGADMLLGLSKGDTVTPEMLQSMAADPIVFALANPNPEIPYAVAMQSRPDVIMATGRSDHPNQVNNVLGFPFIFRGALDVKATTINEPMKLAAARALANLARESVPESVIEAYADRNLTFGRNMIIPKPLDPRLIGEVATAVARAAIESGVAREEITDWDAYRKRLNERMGFDQKLLRGIAQRAKLAPKRVVFAEANNYKVLKAAQICADEGTCTPVLLGEADEIQALATKYHIEIAGMEIIDPRSAQMKAQRTAFAEEYFHMRARKGITRWEADRTLRDRNYYGAMLVHKGMCDAMISGISRKYSDVIRPALEIIGRDKAYNTVCGMYMLLTKKKGPLFFADTTVNVDPTTEQMVDTVRLVHRAVKRLRLEPRIAVVSYSNFGSSKTDEARQCAEVVRLVHERHPEILVDGEIQANFALNREMLQETFPFSRLAGKTANVFVFPNLAAGNIAYKLLQEAAEVEAIGPILLGMRRPYHVLQLGCSVREIVHMARIAVVDAQTR